MINQIKKGIDRGESISAISQKLGIDRKTVRKYRDMGHDEVASMMKRCRKRAKKIDRFMDYIKERIKQYEDDGGINCQSLYYEIKELGYMGSARTLRRYVSRLKRKHPKRIFKPFETEPGHQAMVDLGEKRGVMIGGKKLSIYFIAMVLSYSRKKYVEWFDYPVDTTTFIEFHRRAFENLGGIPNEVVYDQSKLAVVKEKYGEVEFNKEFYRFSHYYGYEPYICHKYDAPTKGKIEAVIKYIKHGFLKGRTFEDLSDLISQWDRWLSLYGDEKIHETTGKSPNALWEKEKQYLKPIPSPPYEVAPCYKMVKVSKAGLISVLGNSYSVPCKYHRQTVKVFITEEKIHIYSIEGEHIYSYFRCTDKGKRIVVNSHYQRELSPATPELEAKALGIYKEQRILKVLKKRFPRHYRTQLKGLIALKKRYSEDILSKASHRALAFNCLSYGNVDRIARAIIERHDILPQFEGPNAAKNHYQSPLACLVEVRPLSYYERLLFEGVN